MILTAHQPVLMPWCGFFAKLAAADRFIVFDGVQFERKGYSNRVQIKTHHGPIWLTVPVEHGQPLLREAKIVPGNWARKHLKSIELAYAKAPYFGLYYNQLRDILSHEWRYLAGLDRALLDWLLRKLGLSIPIHSASENGFDFEGEKSCLVLDMCVKTGATEYIFGSQGRGYADVAAFEAAGVKPVFQDYRHPVYPQLHGDFVAGLSVLDLLMNVGPGSLDVIVSRGAM